MANVTVNINGSTYVVPGQGYQGDWGQLYQDLFVALAAVAGSGATTITGNFTIVQPVNTEAGYYVSAPGNQGGITDGLWSYGRPSVAGVGLQTIRTLYSDQSTAEHIVSSLESQGTLGIIGNGDLRARYESYNLDGEQNPHYRTNTFPGPGVTIECGRNGCVVPVGGLTRSGSTVTANAPAGHVFAVGDYISLTCNDPNYPQGLEIYQVATVPDSTHFTYTSGGTTVASTAQGIFTTPVDCKMRVAGQKHWQMLVGDHAHEAAIIDFYADYMVTAPGYGASYGGGLVFSPVNLSGTTTLNQAGHWFLCTGTWTFTSPTSGSYFAKPGQEIVVTNVSSGTITVSPNTSVTFRDHTGTLASISLAQGASVRLRCDGQGTLTGNATKDTWYVIGSN